MYFFNFHDFQIIGASPEILVRLREDKITIYDAKTGSKDRECFKCEDHDHITQTIIPLIKQLPNSE